MTDSRFAARASAQPLGFGFGVLLLASCALITLPQAKAAPTTDLERCGLHLDRLTVYAREGIDVQRSDILGLTASGGDVEASKFAFVRRFESQDHTLGAAHPCNRLTVLSEGMFRDRTPPSVSLTVQSRKAPLPQLGDSAPTGNLRGKALTRQSKLDFLAEELTLANTRLLERSARASRVSSPRFIAQPARAALQSFEIEGRDLARAQTWTFIGSSKDLFLVKVTGSKPLTLSAHVQLFSNAADGSLPQPGNILFFFPEATSIQLRQGGASPEALGYNVGYPIVFFAPEATLAASELLITGAIFSKRFMGLHALPGSAGEGAAQLPTAQVNGVFPHPAFELGTGGESAP
jgi:choice-of-anchor A domain-containing protein